jgi:prepilin-type N-terminal cleavage/methylation domain-containing protein
MTNHHPRESGFSLLELIIVLVVMVSLLAIAWPNMQRPLRRTSLNEAAQTLRSAIDDSRYRAITTGEPVFVELRQGARVLRASGFDGFMDSQDVSPGSEARSDATLPVSQTEDGQTLAASGSSSLSPSTSTIQTWRLPDPVEISDVRWTLATPVQDYSSGLATDSSPVAEVQSESMLDLEREATQQTWWLPLVATGQGRDAAIVLVDTTVNEEITVTFVAATGALEIVK